MNPWLPFEWIVALRFLREGRMQTLFIVSGIAIGVAFAAIIGSILRSFVFGVTVLDPTTYVAVPLFLSAAALASRLTNPLGAR